MELGCVPTQTIRSFTRSRNRVLRSVQWPWLNWPLFGPLTWLLIDVNILEAVLYPAAFVGCVFIGIGGSFGVACCLIGGLLLLPVSRHNLITALLGIPHARLVKYHRWTGALLGVPIVIHGLLEGEFFSSWRGITGTLCLCLWGFLVAFSLEPVRRLAYYFFYYPHFVFIVYYIFSILHTATSIWFLLPGAALYALDLVLRCRGRFSQVVPTGVERLPGSVVRVRLPRTVAYKAGQYVSVNVRQVSVHQWHPYSLTSAPDDEGVELLMRGLGDWSKSVLQAASRADGLAMSVVGGFGNFSVAFRRHPVAVLVAGGIGITPFMSLLRDMKHRDSRGDDFKVRHIYLLWAVRQAAHLAWFPDLRALTGQHTQLTITPIVHVTGTSAPVGSGGSGGSEGSGSEQGVQEDAVELGGAKVSAAGRPDVLGRFREIGGAHPACDSVAVLACGPDGLVQEARWAAVKASTCACPWYFTAEDFSL
eukprot:CAMPEP_0177687478 /NCGR_PEP_ID=MMETSP0447-20121125/34151_2 /TAXON_ID=0 /ORGANISM="Stygamoeba regulata, Strain BSH-02190019" /LENGTH=476 /DNA_ID=CAMNT_0019197725 /DNA_START=211 /DNA_END=1641 /DNA_ORIENTATION=-